MYRAALMGNIIKKVDTSEVTLNIWLSDFCSPNFLFMSRIADFCGNSC